MKRFWAILAGFAFFGMCVGLLCHNQGTFGMNAAMFMFDLYMLLFAEA